MLEIPKELIDGGQNCKNVENKFNKFYGQKDFRYRSLKRHSIIYRANISKMEKEREMNYKNTVPILNRNAVRN